MGSGVVRAPGGGRRKQVLHHDDGNGDVQEGSTTDASAPPSAHVRVNVCVRVYACVKGRDPTGRFVSQGEDGSGQAQIFIVVETSHGHPIYIYEDL